MENNRVKHVFVVYGDVVFQPATHALQDVFQHEGNSWDNGNGTEEAR